MVYLDRVSLMGSTPMDYDALIATIEKRAAALGDATHYHLTVIGFTVYLEGFRDFDPMERQTRATKQKAENDIDIACHELEIAELKRMNKELNDAIRG